jgi:hypothetical protein
LNGASRIYSTEEICNSKLKLNISIALDLSNSMLNVDSSGQTRLDRSKDAISLATNYLRTSADRLALSSFSWNTWLDYPFTSAFGHDKTAFNAVLSSLTAKSWTNIGEGFERARAQYTTSFAPPPPGVIVQNVIMVITDGQGVGRLIRIAPGGSLNTALVPPTEPPDGYYYRFRGWATAVSNGLPPELGIAYTPDPGRETNYYGNDLADPWTGAIPPCRERVEDPTYPGTWINGSNGSFNLCPYTTSVPPSPLGFPSCDRALANRDCSSGECCFLGNTINGLDPAGNLLAPSNLPLDTTSFFQLFYATDFANADYARTVQQIKTFTIAFDAFDSQYLERLALDEKCFTHPPYTDTHRALVPHCNSLTNLSNSGVSLYPSGSLPGLMTAIAKVFGELKVKWTK